MRRTRRADPSATAPCGVRPANRTRRAGALVLLLLFVPSLALTSAGCASNPVRRTGEVPRKIQKDAVPSALERSEAALAEGRYDLALEWAYVASRASGLTGEERTRVQTVLERSADLRIAELSNEESDPKQLARFLDVGLPRPIAVTAGIRAAELRVQRGEHKDAFEVLRRMDELYPNHHERQAAGALLARSGFALSEMGRGFWFFGGPRDRAFQVLEYLILQYPAEARCDEAYFRLAQLYEEDRKWQLAMERLQELATFHSRSRFVPAALARIPHLRLRSIESPEYDRKAIVLARSELEKWLRAYPGHALEPDVRDDLDDALRRLAQSDIVIARFYRRVGNSFGARFHAERAVLEARLAGDESRERTALSLLERLGRARPVEDPSDEGIDARLQDELGLEAVRD